MSKARIDVWDGTDPMLWKARYHFDFPSPAFNDFVTQNLARGEHLNIRLLTEGEAPEGDMDLRSEGSA